jgi:hypothetical protein
VLVVCCIEEPPGIGAVPSWEIAAGSAPEQPTLFGEEDTERGLRVTQARTAVTLVLRSRGAVARAVLAGMEIADGIAEHADGVVIDVVAERLMLPGEWRVDDRRREIDAREHVTVHVVEDGGALWIHTHGLLKFGRPELEVFDVPYDLQHAVAAYVVDTGGDTIDGAVVAPGHRLGGRALRAREGRREDGHWNGRSVLELYGARGTTADAMRAIGSA